MSRGDLFLNLQLRVFSLQLNEVKRIFFLLLAAFFVYYPSTVQANEFSSFYQTTYDFDNRGIAQVTQEVSLINQTADYYVSEYNLSLVGGKISSIEAYDKVGPLQVKTQEKEKTTIVSLKFNEKVAGIGKVLSFILKYQVDSLAKKEGNLWQIAIPRLANHTSIDEYQLRLKIPESFGKIALVNPSPQKQELSEGFYFLDFKKEDLLDFGVMVTLGQYQTFDFLIYYDLQNPGSAKAYQKITLPPDTRRQTIYFQSLEPEPLDVEVDEDGNWLALYELGPKESLRVEARGQADIYSSAKTKSEPGSFPGEQYLSGQRFWPIKEEKIVQKAKELKTVQNIYRFVVDTLSYNLDEVKSESKRKGALLALENPQKAVCSEFTDLFIALCRAAGIPARELVGYAFTENEDLKEIAKENDLLHSWAEYFDREKGEWVMVDPTWEKTSGGVDYFNKFDMSHLVFAIHGLSDSQPPSPGAYRLEKAKGKQIFVDFAKKKLVKKDSNFTLESIKPQTVFTAKNNQIKLVLRNKSGFGFYNQPLKIEGNLGLWPQEHLLKSVPPYSRFTLSLLVKPKELMRDYQETLTLSLDQSQLKINLKIFSLILRLVLVGGGFFGLILTFLLFNLRKKPFPDKEKNVKLDESGENS